MIKSIGFVFDTQEEYCISDSIAFADFCYEDEAAYIKKSLEKEGYQVTIYHGACDFYNNYLKGKKEDIIFNKCEGFNSRNREGLFPAVLEFLDIPYVGTDAYGLSLSLNKYHTKLIADSLGVKTPNYFLIENNQDINNVTSLQFPVIIKPNTEGSSMGIEIVDSISKMESAVRKVSAVYGFPLLCEEYIYGNEVSVPIIGTGDDAEALGVVEFRKKDGSFFSIYSTDAKYYSGCDTLFLESSESVLNRILKDSLEIYKALGCRDFGRVDFRVREDETYFLEINPLPTLCEGGSFELCANSMNSSFPEIIDRIVKSAALRYGM